MGQVQRRIRQYKALTDDTVRFRLARQVVRAKLEGQSRFLLRATRGPEGVHDRNTVLPQLAAIATKIAGHAGRQRALIRDADVCSASRAVPLGVFPDRFTECRHPDFRRIASQALVII